MPAPSEFRLAHKLSEIFEEVADYMRVHSDGFDGLVWFSRSPTHNLEDLKECSLGINPEIETFDCSVFDGQSKHIRRGKAHPH